MAHKQPASDLILDLICNFVDKSGGVDKVRLGADALLALAKKGNDDTQDYVRRISESKEASNQLCAAALLGLRLAETIYKGRK